MMIPVVARVTIFVARHGNGKGAGRATDDSFTDDSFTETPAPAGAPTVAICYFTTHQRRAGFPRSTAAGERWHSRTFLMDAGRPDPRRVPVVRLRADAAEPAAHGL
jgi:hypothetical protein